MKLKKVKKSKVMRGKGMGTHGWGARKKHMGSGHRGGFGMAGTGKRADQKKSLVIKKYDKYFGKQGITSKSTKKRINKVMNLSYIESNIESLLKKFGKKDGTIDVSDYKILGSGEIKTKVVIKAGKASESAKKKIEAAGGKLILPEIKIREKPKPQPTNKNPQIDEVPATKAETKEEPEVPAEKEKKKKAAPKGVPSSEGKDK